MKLRKHRLSREMFADLAAGGGAKAAVDLLANVEYSKRLLLLRSIVDLAERAGHRTAAEAARGFDLLSEIQKSAPAAVDDILRYPSTGAWAQHTVRGLLAGGESPVTAPGRLQALAAAAAIRGGIRTAVEVTVEGNGLSLPSLGVADLPGGRAMVRVGGDGTEITGGGTTVRVPPDPHVDAPGWHGLRRLTARSGGLRLDLTIDDLDPYRMPTMNNVTGRLDPREVRQWSATLGPAWETLVRHHALVAGEIQAGVRVVTPLFPPDRGQVSASARDTIGCTAMSAPPDARSLAVTLAHEIQHTKLAMLMELVELAEPDDGSRYYTSWRDDPRPVSGLLQGAYAYVGVAGFWLRQRAHEKGTAELEAHTEFARWRAASELVTRTLLDSGRLTHDGTIFVNGMLRTLRKWADEPVPPAAAARARLDEEAHRSRWLSRNGAISTPSALD